MLVGITVYNGNKFCFRTLIPAESPIEAINSLIQNNFKFEEDIRGQVFDESFAIVYIGTHEFRARKET
jgi:hypothetical protein